jgi:hypothetical protein
MENKKMYRGFLSMIIFSMLAMYAISYLNCDKVTDFRWSETRLYMNLMMGSAMAVIMLTFMKGMYRNKKLNGAIYGISGIIFVVSFSSFEAKH